MGHRSLVAFQRPDGNFNIHYSHWGSTDLQLEQNITKNQPLGGESSAPPFLTELTNQLVDETDDNMNVSGHATKAQTPTEIEREPDIVNVEKDDIGVIVDEYGDPTPIEALYVVTREFDVTGFYNTRIRFNDTDYGTLLFQPRWYNGEPTGLDYARGFLTGQRRLLSKQIRNDVLDVEDAYDAFLDLTLEFFQRGMNKRILPHSTAIPSSYYHDHITAFLGITGMTSIPPGEPMGSGHRLDNSIPTGFDDYQPWELPTDFPNPEEFVNNPEKLNPHQFDEHGNFIPDADKHVQASLTQTTFSD